MASVEVETSMAKKSTLERATEAYKLVWCREPFSNAKVMASWPKIEIEYWIDKTLKV